MNVVARIFLVLLFLLSHVAPTTAGRLPWDVVKLDAAGVQKYLIGNTVVGAGPDGKVYEEYYASDGTIHGLWNHRTNYSGTWTVQTSNGWMCFKYKDFSGSGCWFIAAAQTGRQLTAVYWLKSDGSLDGGPTPVKQGNPYGL